MRIQRRIEFPIATQKFHILIFFAGLGDSMVFSLRFTPLGAWLTSTPISSWCSSLISSIMGIVTINLSFKAWTFVSTSRCLLVSYKTRFNTLIRRFSSNLRFGRRTHWYLLFPVILLVLKNLVVNKSWCLMFFPQVNMMNWWGVNVWREFYTKRILWRFIRMKFLLPERHTEQSNNH